MKEIIPAILVDNFSDFKKQTEKLAGVFNKIQIDVMDGQFVAGHSFTEIDQVKEMGENLSFELHLMVDHPLIELEKWENIKNIFRIVIHIESKDDLMNVINKIKGRCAQVGLALNPDTSLEKVKPYLDHISEVLFMTVVPGKQGAKFETKVVEKIKKFTRIVDHPLCAVDGGINKNNIKELSNCGVEIFYIGSDLTLAENPKQEYDELTKLIKQ
jgi:ribulose-phosphate 3-epimerase